MHAAVEFIVKLVVAAILALAAGLLAAAFGITLPWWVCALIGVAVVFGGVLIITHADDW